MTFRLRESDCKTLEHLAEYRILTMSQLAATCHKNKPAVRKRIRDLRKEGFVKVAGNEYGQNSGRPETLLGLTEQGVDTLKQKKLIANDVPYENVGSVTARLIDHQLLLNWFRIHLGQIERVLPRLSVRFLAHNSPLVPQGPDGRVITTDSSPIGRRAIREVKFTPDAVFVTTDAAEGKTLLFFLEVDCGTETLSSPQRDMTDIRQKILNYQWYFQSLKYKRYEEIFETSYLPGFRLLFLTKTAGRLAALCRLTQEMQPSSFIWLTEQERMLDDGVSWNIWARGGNLQVTVHGYLDLTCTLH
jgi:predicted transcriptional regulator